MFDWLPDNYPSALGHPGAIALNLLVSLVAMIFIYWKRASLVCFETSKVESSTVHPIFGRVILLGVPILLVLERYMSYGEAYETDIMIYSIIAERMLNGESLYVDIWDHKPPGIYLIYSAFFYIFGMNPFAIYMMVSASAILTYVGIYRVAGMLGGKNSGLLACVFWAIFSGDYMLQANQPNAEVFINLFLTWGLYFFIRLHAGNRLSNTISASIMFFLATFFKTVAIFVPIFLALASTYICFKYKKFYLLKSLFLVASISAALWFSTLIYFASLGHLNEALEAIFFYNQEYAGSILYNLIKGVAYSSSSNHYGLYFIPLCIISVGILLSNINFNIHLVAFLLGSWFAVVTPGMYFPHYYQLILPGISIGFSLLMTGKENSKTFFLATVILLSLALPFKERVSQFFSKLDQIPTDKYGLLGDEFKEAKNMGAWLSSLPDEHIYHVGQNVGVYFWANKFSQARHLYTRHLIEENEYSRSYARENLEQLKSNPPSLVVMSKNWSEKNYPVVNWIKENYSKFEPEVFYQHTLFYRRKVETKKP